MEYDFIGNKEEKGEAGETDHQHSWPGDELRAVKRRGELCHVSTFTNITTFFHFVRNTHLLVNGESIDE